MNRRNFLGGLAGIFAAGFAPAIGHAGILMPVKKIAEPHPFHPFERVTAIGRFVDIESGWTLQFPGAVTDMSQVGDLLIVTAAPGRRYAVTFHGDSPFVSPLIQW